MRENLLEMRSKKGMPTCIIIFLNNLEDEENNAKWEIADSRNADIQLSELRKVVEKYKDEVWYACLKIMEYAKGVADAYYWFSVLNMLKCEMDLHLK